MSVKHSTEITEWEAACAGGGLKREVRWCLFYSKWASPDSNLLVQTGIPSSNSPTPLWLVRGAHDTGGPYFGNYGDWPKGEHPTQAQLFRALPELLNLGPERQMFSDSQARSSWQPCFYHLEKLMWGN